MWSQLSDQPAELCQIRSLPLILSSREEGGGRKLWDIKHSCIRVASSVQVVAGTGTVTDRSGIKILRCEQIWPRPPYTVLSPHLPLLSPHSMPARGPLACLQKRAPAILHSLSPCLGTLFPQMSTHPSTASPYTVAAPSALHHTSPVLVKSITLEATTTGIFIYSFAHCLHLPPTPILEYKHQKN